ADRELFKVDRTPEESSKLTREGIELILRCWQGEPFEFEGDYFHLSAAPARAKILDGVLMQPYQQPHPPIAIAGNTRGSYALRNAGARGWIPMSAQFLAPNALRTHAAAYTEGACEAGRKPNLSL